MPALLLKSIAFNRFDVRCLQAVASIHMKYDLLAATKGGFATTDLDGARTQQVDGSLVVLSSFSGVTESPALIPGRPVRADGGYSRRASRDGPTAPPARAVARRGAPALSEPLVLLAPPPRALPPGFGSAPAAGRSPDRAAHAQSPSSTPPSARYTRRSARPAAH